MPRLSPQQIADKMASRASAAQGDYTAGVQAVSVAPGAKAAAKKAQYVQNVQASADKWAARVGRVTLEQWKQSTTDKAGRFASGVTAAKPKIVEFWTSFGPFQDNITATVRNMPNATQEERINRAVAQMRGTATYKR